MNLTIEELRSLIVEELRISPLRQVFLREDVSGAIEKVTSCKISDWTDYTINNWGDAGGPFSMLFYQRTPSDWFGFGSDSWLGALNKLAHKQGLPGTQIVRTYLGAEHESKPKSGALIAKKIFDTVPVLDNCTVGGALKIVETDGGFDVKIQCQNTPMPPIYLRDLVYMVIDSGNLDYVKEAVVSSLRDGFEAALASSEDSYLNAVDHKGCIVKKDKETGEPRYLGDCVQEHTRHEIAERHFELAIIAVNMYIDDLLAPLSEAVSCWLTILQRVMNHSPIIFWALINGMEVAELIAGFDIPDEHLETWRDSNNFGKVAFCNTLINSIPDDVLVTIRSTCLKIQRAFTDPDSLIDDIGENAVATLQAYQIMDDEDATAIGEIVSAAYNAST